MLSSGPAAAGWLAEPRASPAPARAACPALSTFPVTNGNSVFKWNSLYFSASEQRRLPRPRYLRRHRDAKASAEASAGPARSPRPHLILALRSASSSSLPKSRDTSSVSSTSACGGEPVSGEGPGEPRRPPPRHRYLLHPPAPQPGCQAAVARAREVFQGKGSGLPPARAEPDKGRSAGLPGVTPVTPAGRPVPSSARGL